MLLRFVFSFALIGCAAGVIPQRDALADTDSGDSIEVLAAKPLNDLFSRQWVKLGDAGQVDGQIVELLVDDKRPIAGLPLALVRDGKVVSTVTANNEGKFSFQGIQPGLYSLVSRTNQTIAAFALQVLSASDAPHLSSAIEVRAVRSTVDNGEKVREIIRSQVVPGSLAQSASVVASVDPLAAERRFAASHVVKLDGDGSLRGQLAKSGLSATQSRVDGMTVFVLKDGVEVARSEVAADGSFEIKDLAQGVYGFIAAGAGSFVATSFHVVDPALAQTAPDGRRMVSMNMADCCPTLNCEVVDSAAVSCCEPVIHESIVQPAIVESCAPPVAEVCVDECGTAPCGGGCGCGAWGGGGFAGGVYGGGGGGGAGGLGLLGAGGGGLAGLAGLAGIAAVVANDDNGSGSVNLNQPPVQVSPIVQ